MNRPAWVEYSRKANPERTAEEIDTCKCYGFNQECWANSEEKWIPHTEHCKPCRKWAKTNCALQGHSSKSKDSLLSDMGNRRYLASHPLKDDQGTTCCERRICIHEFYVHDQTDIPWWACVEEECVEHHESKVRNQRWPRIPTSSILKAQKCPCFRNGCLCNFSNAHPYRENLLIPPGNLRTVKNLEDTRKLWEDIKQESSRTLHELEENITKLRKVSTESSEEDQIDINVRVGKEDVTAIIDCGANVDYVNEAWCRARGFKEEELGRGSMEGYDGSITRIKLREAEIPFEFQGKQMRQKFRIIKETSTDLLVLGMPWLKEENPAINWQKRTVELRKEKAMKSKGKRKAKKITERAVEKGRGGYNKSPPKRGR
jgi:hypothetical protein